MPAKLSVEVVEVRKHLIFFPCKVIDTVLAAVYSRTGVVIAITCLIVVIFVVHALTSR
jgi:hypothetical protein